MFIYQTKINDKDGLVAASETQDAGKQVPVYGEPVATVSETDGVLKEQVLTLDENGDIQVSISLDNTKVVIDKGAGFDLTATVSPSNLIPNWSWGGVAESDGSEDPYEQRSVCTNSGTGTVTVTVSAFGQTKSAVCEVLSCGLEFEETATISAVGNTTDIQYTAYPTDAVSFESGDTAVAKIVEGAPDGYIRVEGVSAGDTTITAKVTIDGEVVSTAECTVTVE